MPVKANSPCSTCHVECPRCDPGTEGERMRLEDFDDVEIAELNGRAAAVARKWNAGDDGGRHRSGAAGCRHSNPVRSSPITNTLWRGSSGRRSIVRSMSIRHERIVDQNLERGPSLHDQQRDRRPGQDPGPGRSAARQVPRCHLAEVRAGSELPRRSVSGPATAPTP